MKTLGTLLRGLLIMLTAISLQAAQVQFKTLNQAADLPENIYRRLGKGRSLCQLRGLCCHLWRLCTQFFVLYQLSRWGYERMHSEFCARPQRYKKRCLFGISLFEAGRQAGIHQLHIYSAARSSCA